MARLIVKVTVDASVDGILLEMPSDLKVEAGLKGIVEEVDTTGVQEPYGLIRMSSPARALDKSKTFLEQGVVNSDVLLLVSEGAATQASAPSEETLAPTPEDMTMHPSIQSLRGRKPRSDRGITYIAPKQRKQELRAKPNPFEFRNSDTD